MVTPLASRFAVLPVDDDGDTKRITAKMIKKKQEQAKSQSNSGTVKKPDVKKKQNTKKKSEEPTSAKQKPKPKGESTKKKATQEQWEQWKQKDAEFVDGHYEEDLHQAILESKLDYEEKHEYYDQIKKETEEEKKMAGSKKNKKSNKAQPMSLSQFNQMGENHNQPEMNGETEKDTNMDNGVAQEHDPAFFERIKSEAKKAFKSEQAEEQRKAREPLIDEVISSARYQDRLEKCQKQIARLQEDNKELREKLKDVQNRNSTFLQLLSQGEMKDKAAVLLEVEELKRVKDELSSEVSSLAAQLEQEKSKVRSLTGGDARGKDKKKRTDSK